MIIDDFIRFYNAYVTRVLECNYLKTVEWFNATTDDLEDYPMQTSTFKETVRDLAQKGIHFLSMGNRWIDESDKIATYNGSWNRPIARLTRFDSFNWKLDVYTSQSLSHSDNLWIRLYDNPNGTRTMTFQIRVNNLQINFNYNPDDSNECMFY